MKLGKVLTTLLGEAGKVLTTLLGEPEQVLTTLLGEAMEVLTTMFKANNLLRQLHAKVAIPQLLKTLKVAVNFTKVAVKLRYFKQKLRQSCGFFAVPEV